LLAEIKRQWGTLPEVLMHDFLLYHRYIIDIRLKCLVVTDEGVTKHRTGLTDRTGRKLPHRRYD